MPTVLERKSAKSPKKRPTVELDKDGYIQCRVCACTEVKPCLVPCAWAEVNLCTTCRDAIQALERWHDVAYRNDRTQRLLREAFGAL